MKIKFRISPTGPCPPPPAPLSLLRGETSLRVSKGAKHLCSPRHRVHRGPRQAIGLRRELVRAGARPAAEAGVAACRRERGVPGGGGAESDLRRDQGGAPGPATGRSLRGNG